MGIDVFQSQGAGTGLEQGVLGVPNAVQASLLPNAYPGHAAAAYLSDVAEEMQ